MNTQLPEETLARIKTAVLARRKIEAIKILREASPLGLAEAKQWIDNLTAELEAKEPGSFTAPAKSGCGAALFALTLLGILLLLLWQR